MTVLATGYSRAMPEYDVWSQMKYRCNNKNSSDYKDYGGRGIKVCERWSSFENFLSDMGERPSSKHMLDRKDNDGNYSTSNCRWTDPKTQSRNTRSNVRFSLNGKTMCLADWAKAIGISGQGLGQRLKRGWPLKRALTEPNASQERKRG